MQKRLAESDYVCGKDLREEVQQEGFTRNIAGFARFLEAASFSQGSGLNMASVARDCAVSSKVAGDLRSFDIISTVVPGGQGMPALHRHAALD